MTDYATGVPDNREEWRAAEDGRFDDTPSRADLADQQPLGNRPWCGPCARRHRTDDPWCVRKETT